ncbi:glycosyltransferase family 2 protein [Actinobacillus equuli]|uniref:glycosyltransferase family 2 protein n=1 Tax=Actinobacillus equuli TaxID=718 RepID=UPI0024185EA6|nr:glycosyltransferase family 2 protein [Actinobacillus equuli]MDG4953475.1 glycosyltransferase [Actinobacillus equuli subsp. equuli]
MLLTIIIPIYKTEPFIERCIRSVCKQTLENFQIILVDDCSPDDAMNKARGILQEYPSRYENTTFISLDKNGGLPNARKIALAKAEGEYIASLDSDDYMEEDALELMLNKIQSENADILVSDYYFSTKKKDIYIPQFCSNSPDNFIKKLFVADLQGFWWNKLFSKKLLDKIEILTDIHMQEDVLVSFQAGIIANKIAYLPKALVHYVQYNANSMTKNYTDKSIQDLLFVEEFISEQLKKKDIYSKFLPYLNYRRLLTKSDIITFTSLEKRRTYFSLFNGDEYSLLPVDKFLPFYKKIFLKFAEINFYFGVNLLLYMRKLLWIIRS